jgi:UDP-N-acetylglucosamine 4,6-dehydratase
MFILSLSRNKKRAIMIVADVLLVSFSLWVAFALRLSEWFWPSQSQIQLFVLVPILMVPIFVKFGLYQAVIRYIGSKGMLEIVKATGLLLILWFLSAITFFSSQFGTDSFPRSIPVIFWMGLLLFVGSSRMVARWLFLKPAKTAPTSIKNVLIYGASKIGLDLASSLSHNNNIRILGFIDDDPTLHGNYIQNLKVLGNRSEIKQVRARINSLEVLLAMPNMTDEQRRELLKYLEDAKVTVRTIPSLDDITSRAVTVDDLRGIDIADLLARKEIEPNQKLLAACVANKKVMVTGAGGSIGSELCRQILPLRPACLVLFEHSEHGLYTISRELLNNLGKINCGVEIVPVLGSITNKQRVEEIIKKFEIDTIYHAAAYKHVNLIENNVVEGVCNNIFGTHNVAQAALDMNIESFVLISTDKAVRPTSVMGATKSVCELIAQGLSQKQEAEYANRSKFTRFVVVRFGNVLGSSGSVIPLFRKQIATGGPITITHPEVTRYFMTTSEASQLVLQASSMGGNCSIFTLNMGDPIPILSLAKQLVYLSGHMLKTEENQASDSAIAIQYTGLQKGEKIHEELFYGKNIISTEHPMIMIANEEFCAWSKVEEMLVELKSLRELGDDEKIRELLFQNAMKRTPDKSV